MLSGLVPICLKGKAEKLSTGSVLSCLACYGGGVILATCFTHMMRAAKAVKKTLIDAIENIQPNGTSNWEDGLRLAFHTFNYSRNIRQSTFCEQAIVLFTDETGQRVDVRHLNLY